MKFEIKPIESYFGREREVIKINHTLEGIKVKYDKDATCAIVISMTCKSHENKVKSVYVILDVDDYDDAYNIARSRKVLSGEWATQVGVSLFKTNTNIGMPRTWEDCEVQYLNHNRVE